MGGMLAMRALYIDALLGEPRPNDILQEALPNVALAHVVQSYVGSYGAMVHPVAACATAAVSVEEGVDKIRLGKAELVVAGGLDDLGIEGIVGFGDMSATADSAAMSAKGIADRRFSRANDRRRGGFVESQGGGTVLLARGDIALDLGLPVLGVVAYAQSFADGVHTSIPAPGIGALGSGRGGRESVLARQLQRLGVEADDIAVVSKHDTSTAANDPNEAELHERLAGALGRSEGAPLFVISQKSLTGHAKGGAAAFQMIGLCQVLEQGVVPPNRSLDCVDDQMLATPAPGVGAGTIAFRWRLPTQGRFGDQPRVRTCVRSDRDRAPRGVRAVHPGCAAGRLPGARAAAGAYRQAAFRRGNVRRLLALRATCRPAARWRWHPSQTGAQAGGRGPAVAGRQARLRRRLCHRSIAEPGVQMSIIGIGLDLVTISEFTEQMERAGTTMLRESFTAGERRYCQSKGTDPARSYAVRWAAKEAVLKAWGSSRFAPQPAGRRQPVPAHRGGE